MPKIYNSIITPILGRSVPVRRSIGLNSYRCSYMGASGLIILPVLIYTSCSLYLEFNMFWMSI